MLGEAKFLLVKSGDIVRQGDIRCGKRNISEPSRRNMSVVIVEVSNGCIPDWCEYLGEVESCRHSIWGRNTMYYGSSQVAEVPYVESSHI